MGEEGERGNVGARNNRTFDFFVLRLERGCLDYVTARMVGLQWVYPKSVVFL